MFTIHGEVNDRVINLASALLTGKTQRHYDILFVTLVTEMRRVRANNPVRIRMVVCDFETAILNSVGNAFPTAQVYGRATSHLLTEPSFSLKKEV